MPTLTAQNQQQLNSISRPTEQKLLKHRQHRGHPNHYRLQTHQPKTNTNTKQHDFAYLVQHKNSFSAPRAKLFISPPPPSTSSNRKSTKEISHSIISHGVADCPLNLHHIEMTKNTSRQEITFYSHISDLTQTVPFPAPIYIVLTRHTILNA